MSLESIGEPATPAADAASTKLDADEGRSARADFERELIEAMRQDRSERKVYANRIFALMAMWLAAVYFLIFLVADKTKHFFLSDAVLLALLGSSTLKVIGLMVIVALDLFPRGKKLGKDDDTPPG